MRPAVRNVAEIEPSLHTSRDFTRTSPLLARGGPHRRVILLPVVLVLNEFFALGCDLLGIEQTLLLAGKIFRDGDGVRVAVAGIEQIGAGCELAEPVVEEKVPLTRTGFVLGADTRNRHLIEDGGIWGWARLGARGNHGPELHLLAVVRESVPDHFPFSERVRIDVGIPGSCHRAGSGPRPRSSARSFLR